MQQYETIDLNDYIQTGEGGTAISYSKKDGKTLAKLFSPGMGSEIAEREFLVNKIVYEMGFPTPQPIRLVTDGTRYGAEYELIQSKRSFTRIISQEPEQLEPLSIKFAQLAKELHSKPADTTSLPSMKELVRAVILLYKTLPEDIREKALLFLDHIPEVTTCLHGDLHIGNIITDGERNLWIDVGDFAYGAPEWDLGMLYYSSNFMTEQRCDSIFHLTPDVLKEHWKIFAKAYYGLEDEASLQEKEQALFPYFAVKLIYVMGKLGYGVNPPSDRMQFILRRSLGIGVNS